MRTRVNGKAGISATIIQDSISKDGIRLITFELEYPRFIHAELMTHRMFSRNAASSRAIPVAKMHHIIETNPATPVWWGKNQSGMQAKEEVEDIQYAKNTWMHAVRSALACSNDLLAAGLHKQITNRVTEFAQMMKTIVTATDWDNWFDLRKHPDAQPEIHELAVCMDKAMNDSVPMPIKEGEWHVPYIDRFVSNMGHMSYTSDGVTVSEVDAIKISASCCAQVSYRNNDMSLEKAREIFDKLINSWPQHASPIEHQATPMKFSKMIFNKHPPEWEQGISSVNRNSDFYSGNLRGWKQYRHLI